MFIVCTGNVCPSNFLIPILFFYFLLPLLSHFHLCIFLLVHYPCFIFFPWKAKLALHSWNPLPRTPPADLLLTWLTQLHFSVTCPLDLFHLESISHPESAYFNTVQCFPHLLFMTSFPSAFVYYVDCVLTLLCRIQVWCLPSALVRQLCCLSLPIRPVCLCQAVSIQNMKAS